MILTAEMVGFHIHLLEIVHKAAAKEFEDIIEDLECYEGEGQVTDEMLDYLKKHHRKRRRKK
jgi:uncharacterized protein YhfF